MDGSRTQPMDMSDYSSSIQDIHFRKAAKWGVTVMHHTERSFIGETLHLMPKEAITLGRGVDVFGKHALLDGRISRCHATIETVGSRIILTDHGSTNGTKVNGKTISDVQLHHGDQILIGPVLMLVHPVPSSYDDHNFRDIVGRSSALQKALTAVKQVGPYNNTVLILGQSGTGKEVMARAVHQQSQRKGPLIAVNCGAIPKHLLQSELFGHTRGAFSGAQKDRAGLIEDANNGTLFLDEIADASPELQASLLRFLQEGEVRRVGSNTTRTVDTRIIAATHQDLRQLIAQGDFREDLYARLANWVIELPPLRDRKEDLLPLVQHFAKQANHSGEFRADFMGALLNYHWPLNVRELKSVVEWAVIEAQTTEALRLTPRLQALIETPVAPAASERRRRSAPERPHYDVMMSLLINTKGNIRQAANELGVARTTLYRWIKELDIDMNAIRNISHRPSSITLRGEVVPDPPVS